MVVETLVRPYTLEEFFELDLPEEDGPYELIRGEIVSKKQQPGPSREHGDIIARISRHIGNYLENDKRGKVLVGAACIVPSVNGNYLIPDVAFVETNRIPTDPDEPLPYPDLAIEVVSKSDIWFKVREKVEDYLKVGTKQVWVVFWPDKEVYVYRLESKRTLTAIDTLEGDNVLPGFTLAVAKLFD